MPVVKIIPSKSKIKHIETYLKNPNKTDHNLYFGNLCDTEAVARSFNEWNQCFRTKANQRTYYHIILSFSPEDNITPEKCKQMAEELFQRTNLTDYPYFGTIHTDTSHPHVHYIVNNRSINGKSYQSTRSSTRELRQISNEICLREGFLHSVIDTDKKAQERLTTAEAQMILKKKQTPWKETLRYQIEDALGSSKSMAEFKEYMKKMYGVTVSENKKGELRYKSPDAEKPCPARRLGENYGRENVCKKLLENEKKIEKGVRR